MSRAYVELRAHTAFSFGDGSVTPEALVTRAAALGYDTLGITDTADLGGLVRAVLAGRSSTLSVRIIAGAELCVDGRPAAFLARTAEGYRNLAALVTASRVGTWTAWDKAEVGLQRGHPNVTWAQVVQHQQGLHALTGPAAGPLASCVRAGDRAGAERLVGEWRAVFGDRLAVEVQLHHASGAESALAGSLVALARRCRVPWVVTHDPRYIDESSRVVHDALTALRHHLDVDAALRAGVLHPNGEWSLLAPEAMRQRWQGNDTGLDESVRIADACAFALEWMRPPLPDFPVPQGENIDAFLRARTYDGARERWKDGLTDQHRVQLDRELTLIAQLGFAGFFLVMWDAVRFARERGILCQGRGSAANSSVAYCLGITAVDPIANDLLFERFLSEVRMDGDADAPDIDVDFEHSRREEVLDYIYEHYRRPHAAITCIVQTYRAPNAIQDAMRAFGYAPELTVSLSKRLHRHEPAVAARRIADRHAARTGLDLTTPRGQALLKAIAGFQGLPRLRSTHVGGFVLSAAALGDYLPIEQTTMGRTIVQLDKDDLDAIGVPKFDFLGLGALSMVRRSFEAIKRRTGVPLTMYTLPMDDAATYALISRGETLGMFQIESRAQIASIVHTRPSQLYDVVVQVALIRPGPIQANFVRPYTRRRQGVEEPTYAHDLLRPILTRTQGIPIFQEQAMAIAMALGDYTATEADALRRTMGNIRKKDRLDAALDQLHARMLAKGIAGDIADTLRDDFGSFANYGFPESHAWSFALIAYATAYLKAHYPTEFYLGILNAWPMGFYSPATLIHDARRHGVKVRIPCLRDGDWECTIEPTDEDRPALRVGWRFVRGLGTPSLDRLRAARVAGPFQSIADVVIRAQLTRAEVTALALAGAFAAWERERHRAAWEGLRATSDTLPLAPAHHTAHTPPAMGRDALIALDYHTTGVTINGHPMLALRDQLRARGVRDSKELDACADGDRVTVAGLVVVRQQPMTAKGTIFLLLEDEHGFINVVVPQKRVEPNEGAIKRSPFVLVRGRVGREGIAINVVGYAFEPLHAEALTYQSRNFH